MTKTRESLVQAFAGEAKAAVRLKVFADKAQEEGYLQIARLFRVIAFSEEIHGARALRLLKEIKGTEENLSASFDTETRVSGVAYDGFLREAEAEGESAAALFFSQSRDVEEVHGKLYKDAMGDLMEERETDYFVCDVCGFVAERGAPDECPVCGAPAAAFVAVS
ncbi:MAG: rubrerythrin family protein [Smithellaceae bacterium]|nr:rubrerythrin family protein [Smithellaceae bacterium]